jgi:TolA-binding protein
MEQLEESLLAGMEMDQRLSSGVPEAQRTDDVDFVQLAGLSKAPATEAPLSFYEKGVGDVDADLSPGIVDNEAKNEDEIVPSEADAGEAMDDSPMNAFADFSATAGDHAAGRASAPLNLAPEDGAGSSMREMLERMDTGDDGDESATDPVEDPSNVIDLKNVVEGGRGGGEYSPEPVAPVDDVVDTPSQQLDNGSSLNDIAAAFRELEEADSDTDTENPESVVGGIVDEVLDPNFPVGDPLDLAEVAGQALAAVTTTDVLDADDDDEAPEEAIYNRPMSGRRRVRKEGRKRRRRRLALAAMILVVIAGPALVIGGTMGYRHFAPRLAGPDGLFAEAQSAQADGDAREAAGLFQTFVARFPQHPRRGEAQFLAAFLTQVHTPDRLTSDMEREQAVALFEQFVRENPNHPKVARALTLMGVAQLHLKNYEEAIDILRQPELRMKDTAGALTGLRALARAYEHTGDHESAQSNYLKAASMAGNYAPNEDYSQLAELHKRLSLQEIPEGERRTHLESAIQYWNHAAQTPGLEPSERQNLQVKVKWEADQLESGNLNADSTQLPTLDDAFGAEPIAVDTPKEELPAAEPVMDPSSIPAGQAGLIRHEDVNRLLELVGEDKVKNIVQELPVDVMLQPVSEEVDAVSVTPSE